VASAERSAIATAHSRDDHLETVVMRILRGAGARGLAGLLAPSSVMRPFLTLGRDALRRYVSGSGIEHVDDPTNTSRAYLRNRIRLDLPPAIRHCQPGFEDGLMALSMRAAAVRAEGDGVARDAIRARHTDGAVAVDTATLGKLDEPGLRFLWQAIAGVAGVPLDRRGTVRLARVTKTGRRGARAQVSGGWEVVTGGDVTWLRRDVPRGEVAQSPLRGETRFGRFRFRPSYAATIREVPEDDWCAALPADADVVVRPWAPGDRMVADAHGVPRRVKRFFADAHVPGPLREEWPVVLVDGRIVWIPGVRRGVGARP
jgi:tRNA(Ile)-lysidine synthase